MGHTPTPWRIEAYETRFELRGSDDILVAETSWHSRIRDPYPLKQESEANLALIVKAVNSHETLVSALKAALPVLEATQRILTPAAKAQGMSGDGPLLDQIRTALESVRETA
jgi:hypothetical protein